MLILAVPSIDTYLKYSINATTNLPPHHLTHWKDCALRYIAKIFNMQIIDLYHEKVTKGHQRSYLTALVKSSMYNLFKIKRKYVNLSLWEKIHVFH